jgi:hypothetical protein
MIRVLLSITLGVIFFSCQPKNVYRVAVFKTEAGWGYQIEGKDKVYIYQPVIPGIEGNHAFHTKEEAMRTGSLVLKKLKENKIPAIYAYELDSLEISYPK